MNNYLLIAVITLLVLVFIMIVLTDMYVNSVRKYCEAVEESNKIVEKLCENTLERCEILDDSYKRMYKLVIYGSGEE